MRIVFFGTPDYVIPILGKLYKYHEIVAVVTQSPKPVGREKILTYSAVDTWAHKRKIPKFYLPASTCADRQAGSFDNLPKADLGVCASYGAIIPKSVISGLKFGILNIHPSLLPKYRGASPIQSTIANLETITGVTIIKMDEKMDHGPIVTQFKEEILITDTFESLRTRLFDRSAEVLINLIPNYSKNKIKLKQQNDNEATYTKIVTKQDGFVDLENDDPITVEAKLRAYSPWPGVWTTLKNGKRLKILSAHLVSNPYSLVPDIVQLEGKNPVSYKQFKEAYPTLVF